MPLSFISCALVHKPPPDLLGAHPNLKSRCDEAELNAYDDLGTVRQAQNASLRILERRAKRLGASESEIRNFMLGVMQGAF